ncbi:MAG: PLP-dependent aminotransferase family protein [Eubacteriales bacterium]|nr:PLP-dependent aminotransferase family protein [Eubacteriales bacterium]
MEYRINENLCQAKLSIIRRITDLALADLGPKERAVLFSSGQPADEAIPTELVRKYTDRLLDAYGSEMLQYGGHKGYPPLFPEIRKFLNKDGVVARAEDDFVITYGSSEAIFAMGSAFIRPGDRVIVENPTYLNATNSFRYCGARLVPVQTDSDGVNLEALEEAMKKGASFFYTIPNFGNPSSITMSLRKRKAVYGLAVKYGIPILEDNPYGYLRFSGNEYIPPIKSFDEEGIVFYMGTFSKIVAPGMRCGFLCANREVIPKFVVFKGVSSSGNINWSQYVVTEFLREVDIDAHIARISGIYEKKARTMYDRMKECFDPAVEFTMPQGGMFIWAKLPEGAEATEFCLEAAQKLRIAVVPGNDFFIGSPRSCGYFRLNFSKPTQDDIAYGIEKLGSLTRKYCRG